MWRNIPQWRWHSESFSSSCVWTTILSSLPGFSKAKILYSLCFPSDSSSACSTWSHTKPSVAPFFMAGPVATDSFPSQNTSYCWPSADSSPFSPTYSPKKLNLWIEKVANVAIASEMTWYWEMFFLGYIKAIRIFGLIRLWHLTLFWWRKPAIQLTAVAVVYMVVDRIGSASQQYQKPWKYDKTIKIPRLQIASRILEFRAKTSLPSCFHSTKNTLAACGWQLLYLSIFSSSQSLSFEPSSFMDFHFTTPLNKCRLSHALNGLRFLFRQAEQEVEDLKSSSAKMNNKNTSKKRRIGWPSGFKKN